MAYDVMLSFMLLPAVGECPRTGGICLAGRDQGPPGAREELSYTNTTSGSQTVIIIVDGFQPDDDGTFEIVTRIDDPPPPSSGDTCASAVTLVSGQATTGTNAGYVNDYAAGQSCRGTAGVDRIYKIDVPGSSSLSVTATPTGTPWDLSLNLMGGTATACGGAPRTCLAGTNESPTGQAETVTFRNNQGNMTQTVYIAVESPLANGSGTFSITATVGN